MKTMGKEIGEDLGDDLSEAMESDKSSLVESDGNDRPWQALSCIFT
jgi:hypothetical protein